MKFSMYILKGCGICHSLISKAAFLPFKQTYDSLRLHR